MKILAGVYQPDAGSLLADGQEITLHGPAAALAAGIAVIYQEPALFPDLSVAENMFIGRQPLGSGRRIDRRAMRTEAAAIFARLGVQLDPARIARGLSIADQQVVEIGKAISLEARVIVMDEPTAALSAAEVDRLFDVVRTLRAAGTAVLFISHRLEEVFALCQRVTVMRDGRQVLSRELEGLVAGDLVRAMVGRELAERPPGEQVAPGEPLLTVDRLTREGVFTDISFTVRAGEIVALAGLVGSGRSEVARAIFGIDRYDAGAVTVRGQRLRRGSPTGAMAAGVGFVPEDRRQQGLVMDMSVQQNVALASLGRLRHGRDHPGLGRARDGHRLGVPAGDQVRQAQGPGVHALRRQPAEGRAGQVAGPQARGADRGRAHPGHRRRHQGRGASPPRPARARRRGRADDLLGAARGAADQRPDPGHAGGAADDRTRARGGLGRGDPLRRHRPGSGGSARVSGRPRGNGEPRWSRRASDRRRRPPVPARASSPSAPSGSGNRASSSSWSCSSP